MDAPGAGACLASASARSQECQLGERALTDSPTVASPHPASVPQATSGHDPLPLTHGLRLIPLSTKDLHAMVPHILRGSAIGTWLMRQPCVSQPISDSAAYIARADKAGFSETTAQSSMQHNSADSRTFRHAQKVFHDKRLQDHMNSSYSHCIYFIIIHNGLRCNCGKTVGHCTSPITRTAFC